MAIVTTETKTFYNLDNAIPAGKWIRTEIKGLVKTIDRICLKSALSITEKTKKVVSNCIGTFVNDSNNIYCNTQSVILLNNPIGNNRGSLNIISSNFRKVCALFTARKSIKSTWLNQKDEYMTPNETHPEYELWNNDAIIYALFNTASNQASLRDIEYKGKTWQIENEFFWLSSSFICDLANDLGQDEVYQDSKRYGNERHVAIVLTGLSLSEDARTLLKKATDILTKTMKYREIFSQIHPKYQINTWDAGWYQVKALAKMYVKDDFDEFNKMYKEFENRMRQGVVTFGFLYDI